MMVEVHVVAAVAGRVIDHLQPDGIFGNGRNEIVPTVEARGGHSQFDVLEVVGHVSAGKRAVGR